MVTRPSTWLTFALLVALLACALAGPVAAGATSADDPPEPAPNSTSVGTAESFSGFTLGAAVLAVFAGGAYWYFRR